MYTCDKQFKCSKIIVVMPRCDGLHRITSRTKCNVQFLYLIIHESSFLEITFHSPTPCCTRAWFGETSFACHFICFPLSRRALARIFHSLQMNFCFFFLLSFARTKCIIAHILCSLFLSDGFFSLCFHFFLLPTGKQKL